MPDRTVGNIIDRIDPSDHIGHAADTLAHTLAAGADELDLLVARHWPTESRRALAADEIQARLTRDLWDAAARALARKPFAPRVVG